MLESDGLVARTSANLITSVHGVFNYQQESVRVVRSRRDRGGSDGKLEGAAWNSKQVPVHNGRLHELTLAENGFELRRDPVASTAADGRQIDFLNHEDVVRAYYPLCEKLVREVTGGSPRLVAAFDHNVRSASGWASGATLKGTGGNRVQQPAGLVHGDYTAASAPRRLRLLGEPPKANDALKTTLGDTPLLASDVVRAATDGGARYAFINVWRSIKRSEPVANFPLACCDAATVSSDDLLTFEIHYADRIGENYFARHAPRHAWYFFPQMVHEEAMLIKQWDSEGGLACGAPYDAQQGAPSTFALHSAFADPTTPASTPMRESIEVRVVVVY